MMNSDVWSRELSRMHRHVVLVDAAFDSVVLFFRRRTPIAIEIGTGAHARDAFELWDETIVVHTNWLVSEREAFRRRLGDDLAPWVMEHDDPRGVPCCRAAHLEIALAARSYEEALQLLGEDVTWLPVPDCLAETRADDD